MDVKYSVSVFYSAVFQKDSYYRTIDGQQTGEPSEYESKKKLERMRIISNIVSLSIVLQIMQ